MDKDMTSSDVFLLIEKIASVSGRGAKEELIAENATDPSFARVLFAALNPFTTYGLSAAATAATAPTVAGEAGGDFDDLTWAFLAKLAKRIITGNAARAALASELIRLNANSQQLLLRILNRDLRAGFTASTVNKVMPGLIPTFSCMLAHKFSDHKHKLTFPLYAEPKLDGVRVLTLVNTEANTVEFFSRAGKEFTAFEHLKAPALRAAKAFVKGLSSDSQEMYERLVLDSEVVSGKFNKTVSDVRKKEVEAMDAEIHVFDILPHTTFYSENDKGCPNAGSYSARRKLVEAFVAAKNTSDPIYAVSSIKVDDEAAIRALYDRVRARGFEGLIIKDPNAPYYRKRNHAWLKIKGEESVDIECIGVHEGTGKYAGMLGALICDHNDVEVNVGTGFSDEQRGDIWRAYTEGVAGITPIGRLVEVQYHEVTPDGSLRHPRFVRFRDDK